MKFENTKVFNFEGALRGMRNPLASWDKSDSQFYLAEDDDDYIEALYDVAASYIDEDKENDDQLEEIANKLSAETHNFLSSEHAWEYNFIGSNDMKLCKRLIKAGPEHRKFLRQIMVSVDITAPRYWWSEFDTYKVGTTANSTSTMHKLASTPITRDCFEMDDFEDVAIESVTYCDDEPAFEYTTGNFVDDTIETLEQLRQKYNEIKDKRYWKELIRWLPNGWLQTRTVTMTYENILSMLKQRKNHKLNEWSGKDDPSKDNFVDWAWSLPYAKEFFKEVVDNVSESH